jgi:hypothetical protein
VLGTVVAHRNGSSILWLRVAGVEEVITLAVVVVVDFYQGFFR